VERGPRDAGTGGRATDIGVPRMTMPPENPHVIHTQNELQKRFARKEKDIPQVITEKYNPSPQTSQHSIFILGR
jgi:hypothetical protein